MNKLILVLAACLFACGPMPSDDDVPQDAVTDGGAADGSADAYYDPQCLIAPNPIVGGPCTAANGLPGACTTHLGPNSVFSTTCDPCGGEGQPTCAHLDAQCVGYPTQEHLCNTPSGPGECVWHATNNVACEPCGQVGQPCCMPDSTNPRGWFCQSGMGTQGGACLDGWCQ